MKRFKVTATTAADGTATAYTPRLSGKIHQIEYVKDGANAFADGVDFAITGEQSGIGIWTESNVNASAVRSPRQPTHSQVGAALLYAADGTAVTDKTYPCSCPEHCWISDRQSVWRSRVMINCRGAIVVAIWTVALVMMAL